MNFLSKNFTSEDSIYLPSEEKEPLIHQSATIRNSQITGNVIISENVHIVNAVIRADEGTPFFIGANSNIQDFAVLHAYCTQEKGMPIKERLFYIPNQGYFAIHIDENVTVAHGALIHGPTYIGSNSFIGFKATIDAAKICQNVEIGAHSYIKDVLIPPGIGIAPNAVITKQEDICKYQVPLININNRLVQINVEMAKAYGDCLSCSQYA